MADRNWTPAQREAMDARGEDILVSAAAGSGKTAVLTQRIIDRITDPTDPLSLDQLLVVTYTKAAAAELRTRIRGALMDQISKEGSGKRLRRQLLLLERAEISTIHSFCLGLIRKHAAALSLPATLRVADEGEARRISGQVMDRLLADCYAKEDPDFLALTAQFAVLGDDRLADLLLSLYEKTTTLPEGVGYFATSARRMEESVGTGVLSGAYGQRLMRYLSAYVEQYAPCYQRLLELLAEYAEATRSEANVSDKKEKKKLEKRLETIESARAIYQSEWEMLSGLPLHTEDYSYLAEAIHAVVFVRKPSLRNAPEISAASAFRDHCKDEFASLRERFFPTGRQASPDEDYAKTARLLWTLSEFMREFDARFSAEKLRMGLLDYADLERYTHRLLVREGEPTPAARAVALHYREIYIDEYQDVNRLQDEIFTAISTANRFMVGDIKQSIYAFRGAEPTIFADYRSRFDPANQERDGRTVYLSHNFRCDQSVVDFVNLICADLFSAGGAVSYGEGDRLIRGKPDENDAGIPVQIALLHRDEESDPEEESLSGGEAEAAFVAGEVERLWKEEGIPLSEMALLLRSVHSRISLYEEAFKARGIPCVHNVATSFFEEPEILALLSILHTVENPTRDIYLAGALTGPVFGISPEELIALRWQNGRPAPNERLYETLCQCDRTENPKIDYFFRWLEEYRTLSCTLSSDELIRKLFAETALPAIVGADPLRGKAAEKNLRSFYQLARNYEKNSFRGLHRFLRYVDDLAQNGQGVERQAEIGDADAIRILTIHQSKGLEFRVCFLADTAKEFNRRDASAEFLFHREMGMTLTLRDPDSLCKYQTLPRQILSQQIIEDSVEEEMRILYVALTRAKERLYLTAFLQNPKTARERWQQLADHYTFYGVTNAPRYIDWIMGALTAHSEQASAVKVTEYACRGREFLPTENLCEEESAVAPVQEEHSDLSAADAQEEMIEELPVLSPDSAEVRRIAERFDFVYPYAEVSDLPAKLTVSRLTPDILDEEESSSLHAPQLIRTPAFLQASPDRLTPAERGTATHVFMQFCDFAEVERVGVEGELLRLTNQRFLSPVMADAVSLPALRAFFASSLYREMRSAEHLLREFRFNVELPAADFTRDRERAERLGDAKLLVQGVVDCCFAFPDGTLKLIDYKTDHLGKTPEEGGALLWERYGSQLYYYKLALEKILGKSVSAVALYSFYHGCEFPFSMN